MTGIGGPGGVGPKGPITDAAGAGDEVDGAGGASQAGEAGAASQAQSSQASQASAEAQRASAAAGLQGMDALAGEIAAGRLTPKQAIDYLVDAAGAQLDPTERAELRDLLGDVLANDPYLRNLIDGLSGRS